MAVASGYAGTTTGHIARGLFSADAADRLARDGPNVVVPEARGTRWKRLPHLPSRPIRH